MVKLQALYGGTLLGVTENYRQPVRSVREGEVMDETGKQFKAVSLELIDKSPDSGLYTVKYQLPDHMLKGIKKIELLSALISSLSLCFNFDTKQAFKVHLREDG